tara:strand:+ start:261 stop:455 length:195 start_codon:yes stop_codon:yes gene_type:complete
MQNEGVKKKTEAENGGATCSTRLKTSNRVTSRELLAGEDELEIEHYGKVYRLRHTRQGKLLLTK